MNNLEEQKKQAERFDKLAGEAIAAKDMAKTKEYWKKVLAAREAVFKMEGTEANALALANILCSVAGLEKKAETAETYYRRAIELYEGLIRQTDRWLYWHEAAFTYELLGECGDEPDRAALQKSYDLWTKMMKHFPNDKNSADSRDRLAKRHEFLLKGAGSDAGQNFQMSKTSDLNRKREQVCDDRVVLSVKTKGNVSPTDKRKIYISCHPEDLETCLPVLTKEIFSKSECAIYYNADGKTDTPVEEMEEMRLFVVPVTSAFLYKDCRARLFEYGFAVKNHIPVLPILMEPGLETIFAKKMNEVSSGLGDIQFLNRTSSDPTEIPYMQKLEEKLKSVLFGNELVERIRAAFDAYIFLSYRKMDRGYAKELMRTVHKIPFCRDIAIWYDEFLVPGEAWSTAIAEAMTDSVLMVMAVTPNITAPGNYVIQHEYPNARKINKAILPVELLPTDMKTLRRLFPGIPSSIDGKDRRALTGALKEALQKVALRSNGSSEHEYLIGLAYLGGIDVERDTNLASNLIGNAAERGLPEAMDKLAQMYHNGDGVSVDFEKAVEWQKQYAACLLSQYERTKRQPDWLRWVLSSFTTYRYLEDLEEIKYHGNEQMRTEIFHSQETILNRLLESGRKLSESGDDLFKKGAEWMIPFASKLLANLYICHGKTEKAEVLAPRKAVSAEQFLTLGELSLKQEHVMQAEEYFKKALEYSRRERDERREAEALHKLAGIAERASDFIGAEQYYREELAIREKRRKAEPTLDTVEEEAIVYYCLGTIPNGKNKLPYLNRAHQLYGLLTDQFPGDSRLRKNSEAVSKSLSEEQIAEALREAGKKKEKTVSVNWNMLPQTTREETKGGKRKMGLFGKKKPKVSQEELKKRGEFAIIVNAVKKNNNPGMMAMMADMLMKGEGTPQDTEKAVYWFEKAYELGYTKAALKLALEYATADHLPFDASKAKRWAQIARDAGYEHGQTILDALQ